MAQAIGITLPIQIGNMGYFQQAFDTLTQVKSNFINLILTRKGERVHQPEFGCGIHDYLFEQLTPENIEGARLSVVNAVERWMPFLELVQFVHRVPQILLTPIQTAPALHNFVPDNPCQLPHDFVR